MKCEKEEVKNDFVIPRRTRFTLGWGSSFCGNTAVSLIQGGICFIMHAALGFGIKLEIVLLGFQAVVPIHQCFFCAIKNTLHSHRLWSFCHYGNLCRFLWHTSSTRSHFTPNDKIWLVNFGLDNFKPLIQQRWPPLSVFLLPNGPDIFNARQIWTAGRLGFPKTANLIHQPAVISNNNFINKLLAAQPLFSQSHIFSSVFSTYCLFYLCNWYMKIVSHRFVDIL